MPIFRNSSHDKNFTKISNVVLQDKDISHKARGVLVYLLSKPSEWETRREDLITEHDGEASIRAAIYELRTAGYIKLESRRNEAGKVVRWEYSVYEDRKHPDALRPKLTKKVQPDVENQHLENEKENQPLNPDVEKPHVEYPDVGKPHVGKPHVENQHAYKRMNLETNELRKNGEDYNYVEKPDSSRPAPAPADKVISENRKKLHQRPHHELTPRQLIELYNDQIPYGHPQVEKFSDARLKNAAKALHQYPERDFWMQVFDEIHLSKLCQGKCPPRDGAKNPWVVNFDVLLGKNGKGVEIYTLVYEGKYRDVDKQRIPAYRNRPQEESHATA